MSFIEPISDIQRRNAAVKRYFSQFGHFQQQSFKGGGQIASVRLETIERLTNVRQNFNIKNAAAESAGFKKKIDRANSATENEPTALHRLQYRERQLSLPRNSGGAIFKHYIKCA